eukprot:8946091-Pyramimonas_sp.AAC.1
MFVMNLPTKRPWLPPAGAERAEANREHLQHVRRRRRGGKPVHHADRWGAPRGGGAGHLLRGVPRTEAAGG